MLPPRAPHCLNLRSARPSPPHLQSHALIADARLDAAGGCAARLTVGTFRKGSGAAWTGSQVRSLPHKRVLLVCRSVCTSPAPICTSPAQTPAHGLPQRVRSACLLPAPHLFPRLLSHLPRCPPPSPCTCSAQTPPAPQPAAAPPVDTERERGQVSIQLKRSDRGLHTHFPAPQPAAAPFVNECVRRGGEIYWPMNNMLQTSPCVFGVHDEIEAQIQRYTPTNALQSTCQRPRPRVLLPALAAKRR